MILFSPRRPHWIDLNYPDGGKFSIRPRFMPIIYGFDGVPFEFEYGTVLMNRAARALAETVPMGRA